MRSSSTETELLEEGEVGEREDEPYIDEAVVEMEPDEAGVNAGVRVLCLSDYVGDDARQVGAGAVVEAGAQLGAAPVEQQGQEESCSLEKRGRPWWGGHGLLICRGLWWVGRKKE